MTRKTPAYATAWLLWLCCLCSAADGPIAVKAAPGPRPAFRIVVAEDGSASLVPVLPAKTPYELEPWGDSIRLNWTDLATFRPRHADYRGNLPFVVDVPTPGPTPQPGPGPTPSPAPAGKLHCLFLYESADLSKMPAAQVRMMTSPAVRAYLDSHSAANGSPGYRWLDRDADLTNEPDWKAPFDRAKGQPLPFCTISNGATTFDGPWPADEAALLDLLKKYGGP